MIISVKHCGSCDVLYLGHKGIQAAAAIGGIYLMTLPVTVLFSLFIMRCWSPLMMPFHVFGGQERLVELESQGSMWYWSVFAIDGALITTAVMGANGAASIVCDAFCKIKLITRAMR